MFIDTHTHLYSEDFAGEHDEMIERAFEAGVNTLLMPNIDISSIDSMHAIEAKYPKQCFSMMGLHPAYVKEDYLEQLATMRKHLESRSYVAIGEIGMDLYWDKSFIEQQKDAFRTQVAWAKEFDLPIVIHAREAFQELFDILDEVNDDTLRGVFHCFTGEQYEIAKIVEYGNFYFGIGGVLTYKKASLSDYLHLIPRDKLLLETDAPYLAPVPKRGKRNESSYLPYIADHFVQLLGGDKEEIAALTSDNAKRLFKLTL